MNISHKELCELYKAYLHGRTPLSRRECQGTRKLWRSFDKRIPERRKTKTLNHLGNCAECSNDFIAILELKRATNSLESDIQQWHTEGKREIRERLPPHVQKALRPKRWQVASILAGCSIALLGLFLLLHFPPTTSQPSEIIRENQRFKIDLLRPPNDSVLRKDGLIFQWKYNEHADSYILEIFDESLSRIWKSEVITVDKTMPPSDILEMLKNGSKYYWMVTGFDENGRSIESGLSGFSISD
jgi:hypothetical protein